MISPQIASAYHLARKGYGWEDIQFQHPNLTKQVIWDILTRVHKIKKELHDGRQHQGNDPQRSPAPTLRVLSSQPHSQVH